MKKRVILEVTFEKLAESLGLPTGTEIVCAIQQPNQFARGCIDLLITGPGLHPRFEVPEGAEAMRSCDLLPDRDGRIS